MSFTDMGEYGFFVWTAYGVTLVAIVFEVVGARLRLREALRGDDVEDA